MTENDKADVQALLQEAARRLNPYFMQDSLPHQVSIKSFWLALNDANPQALDDIGLSVFSQYNEDGILLYSFSRIGFRSRKCIEIGCNIDQTTQGLREGNAVNLIVNFGFHRLIIDMDKGESSKYGSFKRRIPVICGRLTNVSRALSTSNTRKFRNRAAPPREV